MHIEWIRPDNQRRHGVDFADAVIALEDEDALTIEDRDHAEPRFKTLGMGRQLTAAEHLARSTCAAASGRHPNHQCSQGES